MHQYTQGKPTKQAHKAIPEGHYEEEQGLKGFFGRVSHLIRKKPSTRWTKIDGPLKPRLFKPLALEAAGESWQRLLYNQYVNISLRKLGLQASRKFCAERNADGDMLLFCHKGQGQIYTEYGLLDYRQGHYVLIPKCVTYALCANKETVFLVIENLTSHYEEPQRGAAGRHAIYDINTIVKPDLKKQEEYLKKENQEFTEVRVKREDQWTQFSYESCYFDVVAWKGDLFPCTLHVDDIMPLMSHRAHLPPSAHSTFIARDFVVCTFVPRPLEQDKDALRVPFYHQNIDYDEVLFYHDGDFFSRDNLEAGMMSFHPAGFPHGPHPKAVEAVKNKTHTDEYAVMIDSQTPLKMDACLGAVEQLDYWKSWRD